MAEKNLSREELDQVGLACIEIGWGNKQKLITLFHHFAEQDEPLPASGVNDQGDAVPNLSLLARLGKVKQGKQVFKTNYARELLNKAIKKSGIEDLKTKNEHNETQVVREHLQNSIDAVRRSASNTEKKLQKALDDLRSLKTENENITAEVISLKQQLSVAETKLGVAESRVISISKHERSVLKRTF